MKKKYIPLILFISISAVYLISAFTLEVRQKACFLASKQIASRFISESEEHLSTLDQYYQADPLVSQFEFVTYPLPNGGFKATLQAKELTTIDQLASSSFFTNVANTYAPELTHFLSTLTCKNTGKVSYLHTNFLLGIDIHDQDPWYDYEIDLIYYSDSYRKECNLASYFDTDTYLFACHQVRDKANLYIATTPTYNLYTCGSVAPDSTPSVCYYLYTQSGKLNKIRLILHKKENQTLLADCFEPLCCLASSQFDFSEEQCTQLKETLTALSSQTIASKSQIINDYHINYKKNENNSIK